jgi:Bacteriophage probable baseplate hub protein
MAACDPPRPEQSGQSPDPNNTDTYAPEFEVEVQGEKLDPTTRGDVLSVKVDMDIDNVDRFELSVNNWDDTSLFFKYSDTDTFDVGKYVTVRLGYANRLVTVMRGKIESLSPKFPESGSPTLSVAGRNSLCDLCGRKPAKDEQKHFVDRTDDEIAELIAQRNGLNAIVTRPTPRYPEVWQRDLDDAMFLMERAKRIDFDLYVQADEQGRESLYFVKPTDRRDSTKVKVYVFEWGKSLMSFTPRLNAARQVATVTVRGWDPKQKKAIEANANSGSLPGARGEGKSGPEFAGRKGDQVVDAPVTTQDEAQKLAEALLRDKAYEFITGDGRVIGIPDLKPGSNVELCGLGKRFSGVYYVKSVSHSIGADGYTTSFGVRRVFDGGVTS